MKYPVFIVCVVSVAVVYGKDKTTIAAVSTPTQTSSAMSLIHHTTTLHISPVVSTHSVSPALHTSKKHTSSVVPKPVYSTHHTPTVCSSSAVSTPSVSPTHNTSIVHTSSVAPTTKPTTPRTTTKKPTTTPEPKVEFKLEDKRPNMTCFAMKGHIILRVAHMEHGNITTENVTLVQSKELKVSGHCYSNTTNRSDITATWGKSYKLRIQFTFTSDKWFMSEAEAMVNGNKIGSVDAARNFTLKSNDALYQAPINHSYSCDTEKTVLLTGKKGNITLDFDHLKIQPFASKNDDLYKDSVSCISKTNPKGGNSIVPIAVGCALAGLIVIVLIAYLIGRRKNNKGYQQV